MHVTFVLWISNVHQTDIFLYSFLLTNVSLLFPWHFTNSLHDFLSDFSFFLAFQQKNVDEMWIKNVFDILCATEWGMRRKESKKDHVPYEFSAASTKNIHTAKSIYWSSSEKSIPWIFFTSLPFFSFCGWFMERHFGESRLEHQKVKLTKKGNGIWRIFFEASKKVQRMKLAFFNKKKSHRKSFMTNKKPKALEKALKTSIRTKSNIFTVWKNAFKHKL